MRIDNVDNDNGDDLSGFESPFYDGEDDGVTSTGCVGS